MTEHFATSPFGGRMMNAAHFLQYEKLRQNQQRIPAEAGKQRSNSENLPAIDRWKLLRALTEAREAYQISHRSINVLEALLSFCGDKLITGAQPVIVFPSNHELSMRLRGMSAPTIRRHLACLVSLGFIIRRDSPNGKRFVRRNGDGEIAMAFGFDLSPLAFKASEIENFARQFREHNRQRQNLRYTITIHLRDISKLLLAAQQQNGAGGADDVLASNTTQQCSMHYSGELDALQQQLQQLSGRVERNGTIENLTSREQALAQLREKVENLYLSMLSNDEMSANVLENERHIQNSKIESHNDKTEQKTGTSASAPLDQHNTEQMIAAQKPKQQHNQFKPVINHHPISDEPHNSAHHPPHDLANILQICPQIRAYARDDIHNWNDLVATASHISVMLGITAQAFQQACQIMGKINAAITIAGILERSASIQNAGGYLRKLTERAQSGHYCPRPMLRAIRQTRH